MRLWPIIISNTNTLPVNAGKWRALERGWMEGMVVVFAVELLGNRSTAAAKSVRTWHY